MGNGAQPEDFEVIKYGLDRAHELELNKFTHALEVEQLKLLILLNGGAATALLTFAGHRSIEASDWFATAIGCWMVGLLVGAYATIEMQFVQTRFTKSLRHRRCATEWRQLGAKHRYVDFSGRLGLPGKDLREEMKVSLPDPMTSKDGACLNDLAAEHLLEGGRVSDIKIFWSSVASIVFFVLGAAAATASIVSLPTDREAQSNTAQNSAAAR